ncbi:MAG TPA: alcohol dehydrogenase catalytic domain-containing protein [Thermodesulfobacteriota bacterium]|nr:alcohol dehydrogenase catalytic domain-containing protein [Thermodesulfobacteriota bacterium]
MDQCSDGQLYTIQAAIPCKRGGPLNIESVEMEGPRDDEVLVCLVASGICRTDIDFCDNWDETDGAVVLGHEGAGVIERIGKRVRGVKPGDHVVLSYKFRDINRAIADAKRGDTIKPVLRISKE